MEVQENILSQELSLSKTFKQTLEARYGPGISDKFRGYEKIRIKLTKEETHITFLCKARDHNIIPEGLQLKSPVPGDRATKIIKKASQALLRSQINYHRYKRATLKDDLIQRFEEIKRHTLEEDYEPIISKIERRCQMLNNEQQKTHEKKWEKLVRRQSRPLNTKSDKQVKSTIINISTRPLTPAEESLLEKGLNFAMVPKKIPVLDVISAVELTNINLDQTDAEEFRWKVRTLLEKGNQLGHNISKSENAALRSLQKDNSVKILPADKGNATVIMDTTTYDQKIEEVLEKGKYKQLKKDPTSTIEGRIYRTLRRYQDHIPDKLRTSITPHHSKPPHLYGLPKIHKPDMPLRPITSSRDSPTNPLAKFLLPVLQPLQGNSSSFVKNSKQFVDILRSVELHPTDCFVSFDVESLYTNVPIEESLKIIQKKLEEDNHLNERTMLPVIGIMELLKCCLYNSYFQEKDRFYSQEDGLPMGSPLSPVIANIYMEWFETHALETAAKKPRIWLRYVDDTFLIWDQGEDELDKFLEHINNIREPIKFTMEKETHDCLPFLDVKVKKSNGRIITSVYRKPTHTGQYLSYESNHPGCTKRGIIKTLKNRAMEICNNEESLNDELKNIRKDLAKNGYSERTIDKVLAENRNTRSNDADKPKATLQIPYVKGISERIQKIGQRYNIRTVFKSTNTLRSNLTKTKPKSNADTKNCIYQVPCECGQSYVGETRRPLETRLKEHQKNTQQGETTKSGIANHAWTEHHRIQWAGAKVIHKEQHWYKRKFKEAAFIQQNRDVFSQPSVEIRSVWRPLVNRMVDLKLSQENPHASSNSRTTEHSTI